MDENEEILTGVRSRRIWIAVIATLPFLAAIAVGLWFFLDHKAQARDKALVDNVTGAAFGCVATVRGDAPEVWGLERALEHMSRMERVTRDQSDPTTAQERARFRRLAADAARGCEELGRLMLQAQREAPHLYFGVPVPLAQLPDQERPERWYRRTLPESRDDALELTRQIRRMATLINGLRDAHDLMPQVLPTEGRGPSELARIVELSPIPRDRERVTGEAWPLTREVLILRRGSIAAVPCQTRYLDRASCFNEYAQSVSWEGEVGELRELVRPDRILFWASFTATPRGSVWAVGVDQRRRGFVGHYAPGETEPELTPIPPRVDGATNIVAVAGGVAVFPTDGSAWFAAQDSGPSFSQVEQTPMPLVTTATHGAEAGVELAEIGHLSLFGDEESGWTSRMSPVDEQDDVLLRIIDAHRRVRSVAQLRAQVAGRVVALLQRHADGPDAVVLSTDFGRTWLAAPAGAPEAEETPED